MEARWMRSKATTTGCGVLSLMPQLLLSTEARLSPATEPQAMELQQLPLMPQLLLLLHQRRPTPLSLQV